MLISYHVVFLTVGLLAVSQLSCGVSIDIPTYTACSLNPACGYLHTADKNHGFCGYLEIPCSALNICGGLSNDLCFTPGEVCISHPRCQSLHVCYPSTMSSSVLCPLIPETVATTSTTASLTTTTTHTTTTTPTKPPTTTTKPPTTTTNPPTTTTKPPTTTVNPVLEVRRVQYSIIMANDKGSGSNKDLVIFKPYGGNGWFYLGPSAGNKDNEVHFGLIVRETAPGILMDIWGWSLVWTKGTSGQNKMSLWRAITHPDYIALGDLFVRSDQQPTQSDTMFMKAVHKDFCKQGTFGRQIWTDAGSGASGNSAIWEIIEGSNADRVKTGAFVATPGYQITTRSVYVLDGNKVKYS